MVKRGHDLNLLDEIIYIIFQLMKLMS